MDISKGWDYARKDMELTKKGIQREETEFLLTAVQNNTIRTNYIKAKINNMQ